MVAPISLTFSIPRDKPMNADKKASLKIKSVLLEENTEFSDDTDGFQGSAMDSRDTGRPVFMHSTKSGRSKCRTTTPVIVSVQQIPLLQDTICASSSMHSIDKLSGCDTSPSQRNLNTNVLTAKREKVEKRNVADAVRTIVEVVRGRLYRKRYNKMRVSVLYIQCWYRGIRAKRYYHHVRRNVILIQSWYRSILRLQKQEIAATLSESSCASLIQHKWLASRERITIRRLQRNAAAISIQKAARRFIQRSRFISLVFRKKKQKTKFVKSHGDLDATSDPLELLRQRRDGAQQRVKHLINNRMSWKLVLQYEAEREKLLNEIEALKAANHLLAMSATGCVASDVSKSQSVMRQQDLADKRRQSKRKTGMDKNRESSTNTIQSALEPVSKPEYSLLLNGPPDDKFICIKPTGAHKPKRTCSLPIGLGCSTARAKESSAVPSSPTTLTSSTSALRVSREKYRLLEKVYKKLKAENILLEGTIEVLRLQQCHGTSDIVACERTLQDIVKLILLHSADPCLRGMVAAKVAEYERSSPKRRQPDLEETSYSSDCEL